MNKGANKSIGDSNILSAFHRERNVENGKKLPELGLEPKSVL